MPLVGATPLYQKRAPRTRQHVEVMYCCRFSRPPTNCAISCKRDCHMLCRIRYGISDQIKCLLPYLVWMDVRPQSILFDFFAVGFSSYSITHSPSVCQMSISPSDPHTPAKIGLPGILLKEPGFIPAPICILSLICTSLLWLSLIHLWVPTMRSTTQSISHSMFQNLLFIFTDHILARWWTVFPCIPVKSSGFRMKANSSFAAPMEWFARLGTLD